MKELRTDPIESTPTDATPDTGRRSALTFFAIGLAAAAGGLLAPRSAQAYYGRCYLCSCCSFVGSQNNCNTCGHAYSDHTGQTCSRSL